MNVLKNINIAGFLNDVAEKCRLNIKLRYSIVSDLHFDEEHNKKYWRYLISYEYEYGSWDYTATLTLDEAYEQLTNIAEYYLN